MDILRRKDVFIAFDPRRVLDFERMLAAPDPPDLVNRGSSLRYEGAEDRWKRWMPRILRGQRDTVISSRPWIEEDNHEDF